MSDDQSVPPDEAFGVLGNEIRLEICKQLGEAGEPLAFSDLYDRIPVDDSAQFNYHLDKTVDQFVAKTGRGYRLTPAGRRVVEAVSSGAVTDRPNVPRTAVAVKCPYCGSEVETTWDAGGVELYCTSCAGRYGRRGHEPESSVDGHLGRHALPPAGTADRNRRSGLDVGESGGVVVVQRAVSPVFGDRGPVGVRL